MKCATLDVSMEQTAMRRQRKRDEGRAGARRAWCSIRQERQMKRFESADTSAFSVHMIRLATWFTCGAIA